MNTMTNQELNTALYQKMFAEQENYRSWLLEQPPAEILNHTYEYTVREDILMSLEYHDLADGQAAALLQSSSPLDDVFKRFEKLETDHMDTIWSCIEERANTALQAEQERRLALRNTPVYKYPLSYARENDQLDLYRTSHKTNIACRDAIDAAIRDNYKNNCLGKDSAKQVIAAFGLARTLYVLANTVQEKMWDGRFSQKNKDWAKSVEVQREEMGAGCSRNVEFLVDRSHPGLVDLFVNQARHEQLLSMPLTQADIHAEASRILGKLQTECQPNSPSGTHFMAQISPDFLVRAKAKDQEKMVKLLPFKSLTISTLKDKKGLYAFITKDENRDQLLRKPTKTRTKSAER